jgi:hypothetical protein
MSHENGYEVSYCPEINLESSGTDLFLNYRKMYLIYRGLNVLTSFNLYMFWITYIIQYK